MFSNLFSEQTIKRAKEEKLFRNYLERVSDGRYVVTANAVHNANIPMDGVKLDFCVIYEKTTGKFPIFEDSKSEVKYLMHKTSLNEVVGNLYAFKKEEVKPFLSNLPYKSNNQILYFKALEAFNDELKGYVDLAHKEKLNFRFGEISKIKLVNLTQSQEAIEKFMMQTPEHIQVIASLIQLGQYDSKLADVVSNWSNTSKDKLEDLLPKEFVQVIKRPGSYDDLDIVKEWNKNLAKNYSVFSWEGRATSIENFFAFSFIEAVVDELEKIENPITNPQKAFSTINKMINNNVKSPKARELLLGNFSDYMEREQFGKLKDEDFLFKYITAMALVNGKRDNLNHYGSSDSFEEDQNQDDDFITFFESLRPFQDVIMKDKHNFLRFIDSILAGTKEFGVRTDVCGPTQDFVESYFNDSYSIESSNSELYKLTDGVLAGAKFKAKDLEAYPSLRKSLTYNESVFGYNKKIEIAYPKITSRNVKSITYQLGGVEKDELFSSQYLEAVSKYLKSKAPLEDKLYVVEQIASHEYLFDMDENFKQDVYPFAKILIENNFSGYVVNGEFKQLFNKMPDIISKSELKDYSIKRMIAESQGDEFISLLKKIATLPYKNSIQTAIPKSVDFVDALIELSENDLGFNLNLIITQDMKVKDYLKIVEKLPNSVVASKFFTKNFYPNFEIKDQLDYLKQFKTPSVDSVVKILPNRIDLSSAFKLNEDLNGIRESSPFLYGSMLVEIQSSASFAMIDRAVQFVLPTFNKKEITQYLDIMADAASNPDFSQVGFIKNFPSTPTALLNGFFNKLKDDLALDVKGFESFDEILKFFNEKKKEYVTKDLFNSEKHMDSVEAFVLNFRQGTPSDAINLVLSFCESTLSQESPSKQDEIKMNFCEALLLDGILEFKKEDYLTRKNQLITKISMDKRFNEIIKETNSSESVSITGNSFKL